MLAGNTINNNDTSTSTTTITTTATTSQQQHQRLMFKIEGVAFDDVNHFFVCEAGAGVSFSNDEKTIIMYVLQNKNVKTTGGSYNYRNIATEFNLSVKYNKWRQENVANVPQLDLYIRNPKQIEERIKNMKKLKLI